MPCAAAVFNVHDRRTQCVDPAGQPSQRRCRDAELAPRDVQLPQAGAHRPQQRPQRQVRLRWLLRHQQLPAVLVASAQELRNALAPQHSQRRRLGQRRRGERRAQRGGLRDVADGAVPVRTGLSVNVKVIITRAPCIFYR